MDQWAYVNRFSKIHPFEKFFIAIVTMFLVLLWDKPVFHVSVLIIMGIGTVLGAGIPFKVYVKYMTLPLLFIFVTLLSVLLEVHTDHKDFLYTIEIFHVFIGISKESISVAIALFFRSIATLTCLYFLAMTTSMQELIYLLEKSHCPSIVTELMVLTYRFIFVFLKTTKTIYYAQSTRLGYKGFFRSLKSLSILSSVLFVKAYMQAKALNQATLSRGYQGTFHQLISEGTINTRRLTMIIIAEIGLCIIGGISP